MKWSECRKVNKHPPCRLHTWSTIREWVGRNCVRAATMTTRCETCRGLPDLARGTHQHPRQSCALSSAFQLSRQFPFLTPCSLVSIKPNGTRQPRLSRRHPISVSIFRSRLTEARRTTPQTRGICTVVSPCRLSVSAAWAVPLRAREVHSQVQPHFHIPVLHTISHVVRQSPHVSHIPQSSIVKNNTSA
jgi:hypothetical protein